MTLSVSVSSLPACPGVESICALSYEGWNFNSGNYLFTTDTK